jgi:hypothetical protein
MAQDSLILRFVVVLALAVSLNLLRLTKENERVSFLPSEDSGEVRIFGATQGH